MEYNEFLNYLTSHLEAEFGSDATISCHKILKNNSIYLDAITMFTGKSNVSSTIYASDYYLDYKKGRNICEILVEITEIFKQSCSLNVDVSFINDFSKIKSKIAIKLINYEANKALLETIPHKPFLDLAAVFYITLNQPPFNKGSLLIQNSHIERWNIDTDILYNTAYNNTVKLLGYEIKDMDDVIRKFMVEDLKLRLSSEHYRRNLFINDETINKFADEVIASFHPEGPDKAMFVLSNNEGFFGASCIIYPDILDKFASENNSDVYILPSSIHETILIPTSKAPSKEELCDMVKEVNNTEVADTERLSDNVYVYSLKDKKVYL